MMNMSILVFLLLIALLGMMFCMGIILIKYTGLKVQMEELQKNLEKYMELAQMDIMCGIYNKGVLEERVKELLGEKVKMGQQAIVVLDIDELKTINDTYGHVFGDKVIVTVANLLKKHFNGSELIGRIGGDEFMVFLPYIRDVEQLKQRLEGLLEEFEGLLIEEQEGFRFGCSLGATIIQRERDFTTLYRQADQALYEVKKRDKNGYALYHG